MNPWDEPEIEEPLKCYLVLEKAGAMGNISFKKQSEFGDELVTFMYYSFSSFDEPINSIDANFKNQKIIEIDYSDFKYWVEAKRIIAAGTEAMLNLISKYAPELLI